MYACSNHNNLSCICKICVCTCFNVYQNAHIFPFFPEVVLIVSSWLIISPMKPAAQLRMSASSPSITRFISASPTCGWAACGCKMCCNLSFPLYIQIYDIYIYIYIYIHNYVHIYIYIYISSRNKPNQLGYLEGPTLHSIQRIAPLGQRPKLIWVASASWA